MVENREVEEAVARSTTWAKGLMLGQPQPDLAIGDVLTLLSALASRTKALECYADQMCELGRDWAGCGLLHSDDCAGCIAQRALNGVVERG